MSDIVQDARIPLSRQRRAISQVMTESATIPQFSLDADVDATALVMLRTQESAKFSYSDAVTAAVAAALRKHPDANASFDGDAIVRHGAVNIGIALAHEGALLVAVVREADTLTLVDLARGRDRLAAALADGKLRGEELFGATGIVSNLGPAGVTRFHALLVPPVATILAVGAIQERPIVRRGEVGIAPTMALSLTCDHRILDGLSAAAVLQTIVEHVEKPELLAL
jgi:pyruvate dehydrogenase E2 component (dihydrolipoamide acetyltransferase)